MNETPVQSKGRILIVDDEKINHMLLSTNLKQQQYHVETATDGKAALALMRKQHFDVVLLDLAMPQMDGYQVLLQVLSEDPAHPCQVNPDCSPALAEMILRCLDKEAAQRYASCEEILQALHKLSPEVAMQDVPFIEGLVSPIVEAEDFAPLDALEQLETDIQPVAPSSDESNKTTVEETLSTTSSDVSTERTRLWILLLVVLVGLLALSFWLFS